MNKYIMFVHGLTGQVGTTWGNFPKFLDEDQSIEYEVKEFGYTSPHLAWLFFKSAPSISSIANGVLSDIKAHCDIENDDIILVGHSMGGIVIKKCY